MKIFIPFLCGFGLFINCAQIQKKPGFEEVQHRVGDRSDYQIYWTQDSPEDQLVASKVDSLLADTLTIDAAVQIAILNNRRLQMVYQQLGIVQADVVQAGLFRNPVFSGGVGFPTQGGSPDLLLGLSFNFLDFLYIPLRKSISKANYEAAKLRVTAAVLEKAAQVKLTFLKVQAAKQNLEFQGQIVRALEGAYVAADELYKAGNIIELDYRTEQILFERAKVDLRIAEVQLVKRSEALNRIMGISVDKINWTIEGRLPGTRSSSYVSEAIEKLALESSLDLSALGQEIIAMGKAVGLTKREALFPQLELGAEFEREGDWEVGPEASISIPLFDQGQAKNAKARARLIKKQHEYAAQMVEIQSRARELVRQLDGIGSVLTDYETTLLPVQAKVTEQSQAQYNAMQIGVLQLLQAKQQEIEAGRSYIELLYSYWAIHTDLELLVQGRNSLLSNSIDLSSNMLGASRNEGGH